MTPDSSSQDATTIAAAAKLRSPSTSFLLLNSLAGIAFLLGIFCCLMPGLQILPGDRWLEILLAPLYFLGALHLGALLSIVWLPTLFTYPINLFLLCGLLWLIALWGWLIGQVRSQFPRHRRPRPRWWLIPLLAWGLSLLWATHLPLSVSLGIHHSQLAALADQVRTTPTGKLEFSVPQSVGLYPVLGVFRVSDRFVSIVLNPAQSLWAYDGFVYDISQQAGGFDPHQFSLAPGSNNGDQDTLYLGKGWYVFQNLFD